jgi:hypothetical protein
VQEGDILDWLGKGLAQQPLNTLGGCGAGWVETGDHPIPRKYVITSKTVTGAPQYTLRIKDWKSGEQPAADAFAFTPPQGATKVGPEALSSLDELPPGVAAGGSQ